MALWIAAAAAAMIILNPLPGLGAVLGAVITFTYYRIMSYRQFGGTTGDVAGYFLQLGELMSLLVFLLVEKLGTLA
jgi:adenosylcobinamide-GDP ribazoletransferase